MQRELPQILPNPEKRFGHTITMIGKDRAIMFGGAVGDGVYRITNDTYSFDCKSNKWSILKPKKPEDSPSPRAAHASTAVEANQLVIFGGAHSHGNLVDNELYLLKLSNTDTNGKWVKVPVDGQKPTSRYGHSMVFFKPFIIVTGGNIGSEPSREVWMLSTEKSPFNWSRLEFGDPQPSARVYHSTCIWKSANRGDMILLFGGRNGQNAALNDMWGLRRHKNGVWDWILAPSKNNSVIPVERYQHSMICSNDLVMIVGGRNNSTAPNVDIPINIYNLESSEWSKFPGVNRFRHVCWLSYNVMYNHGGFENNSPNVPTDLLTYIDMNEMFANNPDLTKNIEQPSDGMVIENSRQSNSEPRYQLNNDVLVAHCRDDKSTIQYINLNDLPQEPQKLEYVTPTVQIEEYIRNLYTTVIKYLLKPLDWKLPDTSQFILKSEIIIALCNEVIKVLKQTSTLVHLRPGVKIFGSIHGQYGDLMRLFKQYGVPDNDPQFEKKSDIEALDYLFLGNYVDRGTNSLEVICLLMALKLKFPKHIHLLRGSHEDKRINYNEGLAYECESRLNEDVNSSNSVFNKLNEVFEYLSLGAVIGNSIFCVHSGIGVNVDRLSQIENIKKPFRINHNDLTSMDQKVVMDLLWSDPVLDVNDTENKMNENREYFGKGAVVRYGTDRIQSFLARNDLQIIIRSHECVMDGAEEFGETNLYTVFSCTEYGGVTANDAAIFHYHKHTKKLNTYTIPLIKGSTRWYNNTSVRKSIAKKTHEMQIEKEELFDPRDRPVTPPRRLTKPRNK